MTTQAQLSTRAFRLRQVNILTVMLKGTREGSMRRLKLEREIARQRKKIADLGIKD
jgi:hypothetical protein